jgi:hypothetical protein
MVKPKKQAAKVKSNNVFKKERASSRKKTVSPQKEN